MKSIYFFQFLQNVHFHCSFLSAPSLSKYSDSAYWSITPVLSAWIDIFILVLIYCFVSLVIICHNPVMQKSQRKEDYLCMKFKSSQLTQSEIVDYSCPSWVLSKRPRLCLLHTTRIISQLAAPSSGQSSITQFQLTTCPLSAEHRPSSDETAGDTHQMWMVNPTLRVPWPVCGMSRNTAQKGTRLLL